MDLVEIERKNNWVGTSSDIIIRQTDQVRLLFRPELVRNGGNPDACVHGQFLYQKKSKTDTWEDVGTKSLASVKNGEEYKLKLDAAETHLLMTRIAALYRQYKQSGIPLGKLQLVQVKAPLAKLLQLSEQDFNLFLAANTGDAVKTVKRVLRWLSQSPSATQQFADSDQLPELNALVGLANLRAALKVWQDNADNGEEEFWQQQFAKHNYVLSQLFAYPVVVIADKAYVGGKRHDNKHGSIADFLCQVEATGAPILVEIKTPNKPLLGSIYRQDVFPPSAEVTGAVAQVLHYRENLMAEMHAVMSGVPDATLCEPRCVIIVGHAKRELGGEEKRRRAFDRFRDRLVGVSLITFDEVFARVESMISLLERSSDAPEHRTKP